MTEIGPVIKREYNTEGTPTSTVSASDSAKPRPTGTKSQAHCALIAKSAGNAKCGGMFPSPICTPIRTPITCAITAPGPKNGYRETVFSK